LDFNVLLFLLGLVVLGGSGRGFVPPPLLVVFNVGSDSGFFLENPY
jgi:hypothetical protein